MLPRERFLRTLEFKKVDRLPLMDFGYWDETIEAWHEQGLPSDLIDPIEVDRYFGLDRDYEHTVFEAADFAGPSVGLFPPFQQEVLVDEGESVIERDTSGVVKRRRKTMSTIPQFLRFPVTNLADYEGLRWRLDGADPGRYPQDWGSKSAALLKSGDPIGIWIIGYFGWPRNLMGVENLSYAYYDQPGLVETINRDHVDFVKSFWERCLHDLPVDCAYIWEDMAYRGGSLVSPAAFRRFLTPYYQETIAFLRQHGVKKVLVDCDGDVRDLAALFIEAGVDGLYPCERAPGSDPVELRRRYPNLILLGGVDKHAIAAGPESIDRELTHLAPIVAEGGYVPGVDHRIPPNVPMAHYRYFCERRKELWGTAR